MIPIVYTLVSSGTEQPLTAYMEENTLPFATLADIGGETYRPATDNGLNRNTIKVGKSFYAKEIIDMCQHGSLTLKNGDRVECAMEISYLYSTSKFLAKRAAREMAKSISHRGFSLFDAEPNEVTSLPELNVDYAVGYHNYFPTVILQKGHEVIKVYCYSPSDDTQLDMETWLTAVAESMKG